MDAPEGSRTSPPRPTPLADHEHTGDEAAEVTRRMKRDRDAAYGPSTPKGDDAEEAKVLGPTPQAKRNRAQLDPLAKVQFEADKTDEGRDPPDDELEDPEQGGDTPPPTGLERTSPPPTPFSTDAARVVKHEGQETRAIRQRVEALEWDDGKRPVSVRMEDTEIEDARGPAAAPVVAVVEDQDAVIVDAAPLDAGEDAVVDNAEVKDVETAGVATPADMDVTDASGVAEVAAEVAETAQALAAAEEEDVHVAEVAAEVSISAAAVEATTEEINDSAQVALEVAPSAEIAAKEDEKAIEIEEGAPEKPSVTAMTPTKAATPSQNSFSAFASASSPFAAYQSTASPFASVIAPTIATPPAEVQKPKAKTNFTDFVPLSTSSPSSPLTPAPASRTPAPSTSPVPTPTEASPVPSPAPAFTSFASTSTVPSTPLPKSRTAALGGTTSVAGSPFGAFAASSGFSMTPAPASGSGFGSYSNVAASPFAAYQSVVKPKSEEATEGRKLGEPVEVVAARKALTEQELVTGEEEEQTIHSIRCKIHLMSEGAWVERGIGLLKLNVTRNGDRSGARLVMRADATHRLLLNAILFSKFSIEVTDDKFVRFTIIEGTEASSYMLRTAGHAVAVGLVEAVKARVESCRDSSE